MDDGAALAAELEARVRQQQRARFIGLLAAAFFLFALLASDPGLDVTNDDSGSVAPPPTPDVRTRWWWAKAAGRRYFEAVTSHFASQRRQRAVAAAEELVERLTWRGWRARAVRFVCRVQFSRARAPVFIRTSAA
jgi:hypothetical protein